jgi:sugar phosphate isomerase/epimerase
MPERLGGADVAAVLHALDDDGYDGWLVLEPDTAITADEPAVDSGALRDAAESIAFINTAQMEEINR